MVQDKEHNAAMRSSRIGQHGHCRAYRARQVGKDREEAEHSCPHCTELFSPADRSVGSTDFSSLAAFMFRPSHQIILHAHTARQRASWLWLWLWLWHLEPVRSCCSLGSPSCRCCCGRQGGARRRNCRRCDGWCREPRQSGSPQFLGALCCSATRGLTRRCPDLFRIDFFAHGFYIKPLSLGIRLVFSSGGRCHEALHRTSELFHLPILRVDSLVQQVEDSAIRERVAVFPEQIIGPWQEIPFQSHFQLAARVVGKAHIKDLRLAVGVLWILVACQTTHDANSTIAEGELFTVDDDTGVVCCHGASAAQHGNRKLDLIGRLLLASS
mmetsp:Transcript_48507/g.104533  ORF Transcript_48507/g.104533 Transcript_48507/m.104533 type:complete len:326 (+) Transcript_48507:191-1168(+)